MKSLLRIFKESLKRSDIVKVVVIGAKGSGKTSLLVSLYSNLIRGEQENKFAPSKEWRVCPFDDCVGQLPPDVPQFDFEGARREMKKGEFPDSTTDWSVMKLRGFLQSKKNKGTKFVTLEILDLPGERVADFIMVDRETKSRLDFKDWSRAVKDAYECPPEFNEYIESVRKIKLDENAEEAILKHYRDLISKLHKKRSLFFTPSTIRLGENGKLLFPAAGTRSFEEVKKTLLEDNPVFREKYGRELEGLAQKIDKEIRPHDCGPQGDSERQTSDLESRIKKLFEDYKAKVPLCFEEIKEGKPIVRVDFRRMLDYSPIGLRDAEFAPLPDEAFDKNKKDWAKIVARFSKAYMQYYNKIVKPLVDWCKDVDQMYYLVDVLGILNYGRDAYDYESNFGRKVINVFKNTYSDIALIGPILDKLPRWSRSSLKKACLIATQADRANLDASDNVENIERLLRELHESTIQNAIGMKADSKNCKAIVCAAISSVKEKERCNVEIPNVWPSSLKEWDADKKYVFKRTKSCPVCDIRSSSVENYQLDAVAKEILNI